MRDRLSAPGRTILEPARKLQEGGGLGSTGYLTSFRILAPGSIVTSRRSGPKVPPRFVRLFACDVRTLMRCDADLS